tara:strand:+ start:2560 stop:3891 length:1332 start_codon:yes stop_codon:yes gene_type:complete
MMAAIPNKVDVLHVAGLDGYDNTHESGNYIVFNALRDLDHSSCMIIHLHKTFQDDKTFFMPIQDKSPQEIAKMLPSHKVLVLYSSDFTPEELRAIYDEHQCQIIYVLMVHDLFSGGCSYPNAPDLVKIIPTPHHPQGNWIANDWARDPSIPLPSELDLDPRSIMCDGYTKNCGNCPRISDSGPEDSSRQLMEAKNKYLSDIPIIIAGVSSYSLTLVPNSSIFSNNRTVLLPIPNDIPYCAESKEEVRKQVGVPIEKKVMLWGTTSPYILRKGRSLIDEVFRYMWDMMSPEERSNTLVLNVGPTPPRPLTQSQPFQVANTGYLKTRQEMAMAYKMADIGFSTTTSDAGPMMVSESLRNECPLVSFDRSVAGDMMVNGKTGYIVKNLDTKEMADRALELLRSPNLEEISKNCPSAVEQYHNFENVTLKWKKLLDEFILEGESDAS